MNSFQKARLQIPRQTDQVLPVYKAIVSTHEANYLILTFPLVIKSVLGS